MFGVKTNLAAKHFLTIIFPPIKLETLFFLCLSLSGPLGSAQNGDHCVTASESLFSSAQLALCGQMAYIAT